MCNLRDASVFLEAVQENLKHYFKSSLFPKATAQRGNNLSAFVFQYFMDQTCAQSLT